MAGPCANCGSDCACRIVDPDGNVLPGNGSFSDPYITPLEPWVGVPSGYVTITPGNETFAGDGHHPTIGLHISTDDGNLIQAGTDGGMLVPAELETPWTGIPGGILTITGGGINGHMPTISVTCEDVLSCLESLPELVETSLTVVDTNSIDFTASGTAGHTLTGSVRTGAGLAIDGTGVFVRTSVASLAAAGFGCADTNGAPIYVSGAGVLRTVPEHTSREFGRAVGGTSLSSVASGGTQAAAVSIFAANPSSCRGATWMSGNDFSWGSSAGRGSPGGAEGSVQLTLEGGGLSGPIAAASWDPLMAQNGITGNRIEAYSVVDSGVMAAGSFYSHQIQINSLCQTAGALNMSQSLATVVMLVTR